MIVKIQRSQPPTELGNVFIYNEDRSRWWMGRMDPQLDRWLGGRQKAFAHAAVKGKQIVIDREAPWQDW